MGFLGCLKRRLKRFRAKWIPVRVKKTRQDKISSRANVILSGSRRHAIDGY
jgi:hypothetical protein